MKVRIDNMKNLKFTILYNGAAKTAQTQHLNLHNAFYLGLIKTSEALFCCFELGFELAFELYSLFIYLFKSMLLFKHVGFSRVLRKELLR
jgi:hypothetical protein